MAKSNPGKSGRLAGIVRNVVPDRLDLRDRPYMPPVSVIPERTREPKDGPPVLNQGQTNACTGFALASVVYQLLRTARRKPAECRVSPYMLYSMARRYDEFPGDPGVDTGSSARGAMKGWFKYGACHADLWSGLPMPKAPKLAKDDWWLDAVRRPLGAYYRIDPKAIADMHVALNEVGALYVTAACHGGWDQGLNVKTKGWWHIPRQKATPADGGHAFAIVGYNRDGFIIQNSWGDSWGTGGRAVLEYEDWLMNAMDCWVAQLGVVTDLHEEIARATSLRLHDGKVQIASNATLRAREIAPFIIDMENNGRLSNTGDYRTNDADIEALVTHHLSVARTAWGLGKKDAVDIAIYAHGGLTSEIAAAETAAKWIPALVRPPDLPHLPDVGDGFAVDAEEPAGRRAERRAAPGRRPAGHGQDLVERTAGEAAGQTRHHDLGRDEAERRRHLRHPRQRRRQALPGLHQVAALCGPVQSAAAPDRAFGRLHRAQLRRQGTVRSAAGPSTA